MKTEIIKCKEYKEEDALKRELSNYRKAYDLLIGHFCELDEVSRIELDKQLKRLGL
jgi:hypothetical protein